MFNIVVIRDLASYYATRLICMADRALFFTLFCKKKIFLEAQRNMADSSITKSALSNALKKLVTEKPFEKISIGEICNICNMNRKSFYYHFHDKYELVVWIFEHEFIDSIKTYTVGNVWDTMSALCKYFYSNKTFYKKILQIDGQNCFTEYFSNLCKKYLVLRMKERLEGITITDRNVILYANFFVFAVYTWLTGNDTRDDVEFIKDLKNSVVFGAELANMYATEEKRQINDNEITQRYRIICK